MRCGTLPLAGHSRNLTVSHLIVEPASKIQEEPRGRASAPYPQLPSPDASAPLGGPPRYLQARAHRLGVPGRASDWSCCFARLALARAIHPTRNALLCIRGAREPTKTLADGQCPTSAPMAAAPLRRRSTSSAPLRSATMLHRCAAAPLPPFHCPPLRSAPPRCAALLRRRSTAAAPLRSAPLRCSTAPPSHCRRSAPLRSAAPLRRCATVPLPPLRSAVLRHCTCSSTAARRVHPAVSRHSSSSSDCATPL